jgi:hypothetical protein
MDIHQLHLYQFFEGLITNVVPRCTRMDFIPELNPSLITSFSDRRPFPGAPNQLVSVNYLTNRWLAVNEVIRLAEYRVAVQGSIVRDKAIRRAEAIRKRTWLIFASINVLLTLIVTFAYLYHRRRKRICTTTNQVTL